MTDTDYYTNGATKFRDGLNLMLSLGKVTMDAQHDIIYVNPDEPIPEDLASKLEELGFHEEEECGWGFFT